MYTEDVTQPGFGKSNLGMYRVQLAGKAYESNREVGLHYQLHRGIWRAPPGSSSRRAKPFRVNIFVGGHPAMTLSAVMPLPEGLERT